MQTWIISILNSGFGYFGIAFLIALENIFPPIPSEVILTLGGFMTTYTDLNIVGVIIASTVGSLIGAILLYYIGYLIGEKRLKKLVNGKLGKILFLKEEDIDKADLWFKNRGKKTVFFCRFIPVIRSLISIPAGLSKMRFRPFILFTALGSIIWNTVLVVLGYIVGDKWETIVDIFNKYSSICLIIFGIFILCLIVRIIIKKKKEKESK